MAGVPKKIQSYYHSKHTLKEGGISVHQIERDDLGGIMLKFFLPVLIKVRSTCWIKPLIKPGT